MSCEIQPARLNRLTQSADQRTYSSAIFGPKWSQISPFWSKECIFWAKILFFLASYKIVVSTIMTGHQKDILFVLTALHSGLSGNHQNQFRTIFGPKICIFYATPLQHPIFGLWWILLNGIITSPHTEVTLDTFGFLVGAHSTAWRAIMRPRMAKMALFGAKNAFFGSKSMFWSQRPIF